MDEHNLTNVEETLIYDIVEINSTFLVTTWNLSILESDNILMAKMDDAPPGNVHVVPQSIEEGYIPGYPCYFWVLPEEEIMISILIDGQRKRGIENFTYYMNSFLTYCAKFVIYDCDSEDCVKKRIWFSR